ncbi:MAG: hypothetical protein AAFZ65_00755, partial [Planctomycetota bacterium]
MSTAATARAARAGRIPTPTRAAWAAAFAACALAWFSLPAALIALSAIAVAVWIDGLATRREPPLEVDLSCPQRLGQRQAGELGLELFDPGTRARTFELALDLDPTLAGPEALAVHRARTTPNRTWPLRLTLYPCRRGRRRIEAA